jgi:hypothetical protein
VGEDDGASAIGERGVEVGDVDVEGRDLDVDENGNQAVLDDRVDGGRKAGGEGDDFVAGLELAVAEAFGGQRGDGEQVRRGTGVDEDGLADAGEASELALELFGEASGGEPEVERGLDEGFEFFFVKDAAGDRNEGRAGDKFARGEGFAIVLGDHGADPAAQLVCSRHYFNASRYHAMVLSRP